MTQNPSGSQRNLRVKDALRIHESLRSVKWQYVRNSCLTVNAIQPPCYSTRRHSRARGNPKSRGGRSQQTWHARATSNLVFIDVIIARKRAPSHRVFVAQVFRRNMCGKRRRRHRFSAF